MKKAFNMCHPSTSHKEDHHKAHGGLHRHVPKSRCGQMAAILAGEKQGRSAAHTDPPFPLGISSDSDPGEEEIMLARQWFTFIEDLISALQPTCDASSSKHARRVNGELANLGTSNHRAVAAGVLRQPAEMGS